MPTINAGASTTVSLAAGRSFEFTAGSGSVSMFLPGAAVGQPYTLTAPGALGPFSDARTLYVTAQTAITYSTDGPAGPDGLTDAQVAAITASLVTTDGLAQVPTATQAAESFIVPAAALGTLTGAPGTAVAFNTLTKTLADATRDALSHHVAFPAGQRWEAYLLWGITSGSGNMALYTGAHVYARTTAVNTPFTRKANIPAPAVNTLAHTYIGAVDGTSTASYNMYVDRRGADASDTLAVTVNVVGIKFVKVPGIVEAAKTGATVSTARFATPINGLRASSAYGGGLFTPITSDATHIYLGDPLQANTSATRFVKLLASDKSQVATADVTQTTTHDAGIPGHNGAGVCITAANTILMHPIGHFSAFAGVYSTSGDITSRTAITTPTGVATNCSYRRFYNNPYNTDTWLVVRGDDVAGQLYKWDEATKTLTRPTGGSLTETDTSGFGGTYGGNLCFGSASVMYMTTAWVKFGAGTPSGYPHRNISLLKSVNNGVTWTAMAGNALAFPLAEGGVEHDVAFPSPLQTQDCNVGGLVIGPDLVPIIIATWSHPESAGLRRDIWMSKWDATNLRFVRQRLWKNLGTYSNGVPDSAYVAGGRIVTVFSEVEDFSANGNAAGIPPVYPDCRLIAMWSDDSGATWTWAQLGNASNWSGAYIDAAAFQRTGGKLLRLLGRDNRGVTAFESYIYEATLP